MPKRKKAIKIRDDTASKASLWKTFPIKRNLNIGLKCQRKEKHVRCVLKIWKMVSLWRQITVGFIFFTNKIEKKYFNFRGYNGCKCNVTVTGQVTRISSSIRNNGLRHRCICIWWQLLLLLLSYLICKSFSWQCLRGHDSPHRVILVRFYCRFYTSLLYIGSSSVILCTMWWTNTDMCQ